MRAWGSVKPVPGATINWGHPLAQGLAACFFCNAPSGRIYDLIGDDFNLVLNSTASWRPDGMYSGTGAGAGATGATGSLPNRLKGISSHSVVWMGSLVGDNTGNGDLLSTGWDNTGTAPYVTFHTIGRRISAPDNIRILGNNAGSLDQGFVVTSYGLTSRYFQPLMFTVTSAPSGRVFYDGAKSAQTAAAIGGPTFSATSLFSLGLTSNGGANRFPNAVTTAALVYSRALTPSDVAWLNAEPYAFITPPGPKILYFGFNTSGPTTYSTTGTIAGHGVLTGSGVRTRSTTGTIAGSGVLSGSGLHTASTTGAFVGHGVLSGDTRGGKIPSTTAVGGSGDVHPSTRTYWESEGQRLAIMRDDEEVLVML